MTCMFAVWWPKEVLALTHAFGDDATAVLGTDYPVVELQRVHGLKDGRHSTNVGVDLSGIHKGCCQVTVQLGLHLSHENTQDETVFLFTKPQAPSCDANRATKLSRESCFSAGLQLQI